LSNKVSPLDTAIEAKEGNVASLSCCHTLKPQFNDGQHIPLDSKIDEVSENHSEKFPPQWGKGGL
jgi:hypothetical protein